MSDVLGRIRANAVNGSLTDADVRQGEERVLSARARLIEARQEFAAARIRLAQITGTQINRMSTPPSLSARLPKSVEAGVGLAIRNNPRIKIATADIDAANALVRAARARMAPEMFVEGRARVGHDIDGVAGRTNDLQGRAVVRWNLYNGGIDEANVQEQTRRTAEAQFVRDQVLREVRETVQLSMDRRARQMELASTLTRQLQAGDRVAQSYSEQFAVGRRSLLDLLDAQNTRYNASVLAETARTSIQFSEYRILAATGQLVAALGLQPPQQSAAVARDDAGVPPTVSADQLPRRSPPLPGQRPWLPSGAIQ
jgi:adhesin transport system outer membrane protein